MSSHSADKITLEQMAEQSGFPCVSFFTRKFRAVYDCSPTQFRKNYGNIYPEAEEDV